MFTRTFTGDRNYNGIGDVSMNRSLVWRNLAMLAGTFLLTLTGGAPDGTAQEPIAQEEETEQEKELQNRVFSLGEIEVVRKAEESKNTTIEKVYDDEMRLFDRNDLADAVNLLPGVTLSETGARNEKMVFIRGFDIKHVPIFLDGIPIYVPYDGYPDLSRFNTFDLSEVIVSKGFTSVLYGPNTMGGAINMVSRRPVKDFEFNAVPDMPREIPTMPLATSAATRGNGMFREELPTFIGTTSIFRMISVPQRYRDAEKG